jgi:hypothetical protein
MARATYQSARIPPDVPSDPGISGPLTDYLRNFALWCRNGFAEQLRNDTALPGVMLRGYDTPEDQNPAVWMLEASGSGTLALAPMALGSGKLGDPVAVGAGGYLPLSGGTLSGGLNFGSETAPNDDPTDLSRHITLYDEGYGFSVTGATLNIVSQSEPTIQCKGSEVYVSGNFHSTGAMFGSSVVRTQAPVNANCYFVLSDWNGTVRSDFYWEHTADQLIWTHQTGGHNFSLSADGWCHTSAPLMVQNATQIWNTGISYPGAAYGGGNRFAFGWNNIIAGYISAVVDNGNVAYALANASDERMKEDIDYSTFDCLSTVLELPLRQFRWKDVSDTANLASARAAKDAPVVPVGVVAQEIHKIFPAGVFPGDDTEDKLGAVWGLDQNVMISLLIGAVQQLTKRVAELEAR